MTATLKLNIQRSDFPAAEDALNTKNTARKDVKGPASSKSANSDPLKAEATKKETSASTSVPTEESKRRLGARAALPREDTTTKLNISARSDQAVKAKTADTRNMENTRKDTPVIRAIAAMRIKIDPRSMCLPVVMAAAVVVGTASLNIAGMKSHVMRIVVGTARRDARGLKNHLVRSTEEEVEEDMSKADKNMDNRLIEEVVVKVVVDTVGMVSARDMKNLSVNKDSAVVEMRLVK